MKAELRFERSEIAQLVEEYVEKTWAPPPGCQWRATFEKYADHIKVEAEPIEQPAAETPKPAEGGAE